MPWWLGPVLMTLVLGFSSACTRHVIVPHPPEVTPKISATVAPVTWNISRFDIHGVTRHDNTESANNLQRALIDYLKSKTELGEFIPRGSSVPPAIELAVDIDIAKKTSRTLIFDAINAMLYPLLWGTVTPEWGTVDIYTRIRVLNSQGELLTTLKSKGSAPYGMVFFGWYRTGPITSALREAYTQAFTDVAEHLAKQFDAVGFEARAAHRAELVEALLEPSPTPQTTPHLSQPHQRKKQKHTKRKSPARMLSAKSVRPKLPQRHPSPKGKISPPVDLDLYAVDTSSFGLIRTSPVPIRNPWYRGLRAFGGIERAWFWGSANVTSGIIDEDGNETEVANGYASREGRRLTLYTAPRKTGFSIYPVLGYLEQTLSIEDFYEEPPQFFGEVIGTDIEAICRNEEGEFMSCQPPTRYELHMESYHAGFRAGYDLVFGWPSFQFIASCNFGLNVIEHRSINAELTGIDRGTREGVEWLQSSAFGGTLGFHIPKIHLTVRGIFVWEYYLAFQFQDQIEFMGPMVCDNDIGLCQRSRALVDSTHLTSWSAQVALAVVF